MTTVDFIRMSLQLSTGWVMRLAADLSDAPLTLPTPNGGNHPIWCVGHLAYSEGNLVNVFILGQENPAAGWEDVLGQGTTPSCDADDFPSFEEVISRMEQIRTGTMRLLDTLSDEDLTKPTHAPEEMKEWFGTYAQCLAAIPIHVAFHGGQIADARRAAGREPMMG